MTDEFEAGKCKKILSSITGRFQIAPSSCRIIAARGGWEVMATPQEIFLFSLAEIVHGSFPMDFTFFFGSGPKPHPPSNILQVAEITD